MKTSFNFPGNRHGAGFSLIEMMMVIAIAAILMAVGVPSFRTLIEAHRLSTTVNDFFAAINLTRSEAIKRGMRVDLAPADGGDWAKGWVVFIDQNANQALDADEQVVLVRGPVPDGIKISGSFTDSLQFLAYNGTGSSRRNDGGPKSGSLLFTLNEQSRKIAINFVGRPRVCDPARTPSSC